MLKNGIYNGLGAVVSVGLALLSIPILIHIIGLTDYGLWTLILAIIGLAGLAEGGLGAATTVFISQDIANQNNDGIAQTLTVTLGSIVLLATLIAVSLAIGATALINFFPVEGIQQAQLVKALQVAGVYLWAQLIQQVFLGIEQAYQRYRISSIITSLQSILVNLGLVVVASFGGRVFEFTLWQTFVSFITLVIHLFIATRLLRPTKLRITWNSRRAREMVHYSIFMSITSIASAAFSKIDRLIVGAILGPTLLGIYSAFTTIASKINSFSSIPIQPLLPLLSTLTANPNPNTLIIEKQVKQAVQLNTFIALVIGLTMLMFTPKLLIYVVPGISIDEYIPMFRLLTIIYMLYSLNAVGYYILMGVNIVACMVIQIFSALLTLVLITVLTKLMGIMGAIIGNGGYLAIWLLTLFGMKQLKIPFKKWLRWFTFPVLWLSITIPMSLITSNHLIIRSILLVSEIATLSYWFISNQGVQLSSVLQMYRRKLSKQSL